MLTTRDAEEFIDWGWSQYDAVNTVDEKYGYMDWHGWGIADALKGLKVSDKVVDDDDGKILVAWMVYISLSPFFVIEHTNLCSTTAQPSTAVIGTK
jgi:hypothetical protein